MKIYLTLMVLAALFFLGALGLSLGTAKGSIEEDGGELTITILYDNYPAVEGTKTDWGFACLIEGTEKTILFDTGTDPEILWHNIESLGVDMEKVEQIVISHDHGDHTGGLKSVLEKKRGFEVFFPASFPNSWVTAVEEMGSTVMRLGEPMEICKDVNITGEIRGVVNEQALFLDTSKGLVVITGCAHPGIVKMAQRAREIVDKPVYFVMGGFHLMRTPKSQVQSIIEDFKKLGVVKCGATHCTGDEAIAEFKNAFGDNYVPLGTGRVLTIEK